MILFDSTIYSARRNALMKALGKGVFLFPGATEQPFNYKGNTYPFRQDSSFLYYFGHPQPGLTGIIDADTGKSILVGDDAAIEDIVDQTVNRILDVLGIELEHDLFPRWTGPDAL